MKNWNYINGAEGVKIGNEKAISSTFHINDYGVEVGQWSWDWRGKAPDENKKKEIEQKIKSYVQQINKNVPAGDSDERDAVFSQLDKFVRAQGLNKKVGNSVSENSWEPMQAKKYYEEAKKSGDNKKIDEIKKAIDAEYYAAYKAYDELKQRQNDLQVNQDRPGRVPNLEKARSNYELWKIVKSTVGNSMGKDIYQHKLDPNQYMVVDWDKDTVTIIVNGAVRDVIKSTDKVAYAVSHVYKKVNSMNKTCNETMREWATSKPRNIGNADIVKDGNVWVVLYAEGTKSKEFDSEAEAKKFAAQVGNATIKYYGETIDLTKLPEHELIEILEELQMLHEYTDGQKAIKEELKRRQTGNSGIEQEFFKKLADDAKKEEKKDKQEVEKLVENAKDKNDKDIKVGDFVNVTGKKGKVTKIIGDVVEVFFDNSGTYYPDRTDRYYASECTKVGNSKTGNVQYHKVGKITIKLEANDDDWTVYDDNGHELKSGKGGLGRAKTWAEHFARFTNKRTGNSAQDDKFAYVMREFDEGKLKTPDGKVVTDPAQAKAIAYSESKKTENGLARARNAMNKKTGNGLFDTIKQKTSHIKRYGAGSKVRTDDGEIGTVVKETVEVGPNGIPFGWVSVKLPNGKVVEYYDYDLKKA